MTRRRGADRRGQALVEFAIVVPILLLLLLGIVDFAGAWNVHQILTDGSREAARYAVVDNGATHADVQTVAQSAAARSGLTVPVSDITVVEAPDSNGGIATTVTIAYVYRLKWVGWMIGLAGASADLDFSVSSTMRREY